MGLDTAAIDALFVKHAGDEEWMDMEGIAKLVGVRYCCRMAYDSN